MSRFARARTSLERMSEGIARSAWNGTAEEVLGSDEIRTALAWKGFDTSRNAPARKSNYEHRSGTELPIQEMNCNGVALTRRAKE